MKLIPFFTSITKKKIKVEKNCCEYMLFRIDVYFTEYFLALDIDEKNHEGKELIFQRKRQEVLEKEIGCKFIRINTSDAEIGYDKDYEVSKIKTFISKLKDRQLKKLEKESNKKIEEKENKIKELKDEIKTLINKSKCLKWIVKNILANYKNWKTRN